MENRSWKVLFCEFNMDTACVEVRYVDCNSDGKMVRNLVQIYCQLWRTCLLRICTGDHYDHKKEILFRLRIFLFYTAHCVMR